MLLVARLFICVSVCLAATTARAAELEPLPPIFALPVNAVPVAPQADVRHSLLSDRVHRLLTHAVMANSTSVAQSTPSHSAGQTPVGSHDALVMEKVVVTSSALMVFDLPKPISQLEKFRSNGTFYESVGKTFTFDAMFYIDRWYSNRQGSGGTETRAELKFNFRW